MSFFRALRLSLCPSRGEISVLGAQTHRDRESERRSCLENSNYPLSPPRLECVPTDSSVNFNLKLKQFSASRPQIAEAFPSAKELKRGKILMEFLMLIRFSCDFFPLATVHSLYLSWCWCGRCSLVGFISWLSLHPCHKKSDETLISFLGLAALSLTHSRPNRIFLPSSAIHFHSPGVAIRRRLRDEMRRGVRWIAFHFGGASESEKNYSSPVNQKALSTSERLITEQIFHVPIPPPTPRLGSLFVSFSALPSSQPDKWFLDVWLEQIADELIKSKCGATNTHFPSSVCLSARFFLSLLGSKKLLLFM